MALEAVSFRHRLVQVNNLYEYGWRRVPQLGVTAEELRRTGRGTTSALPMSQIAWWQQTRR